MSKIVKLSISLKYIHYFCTAKLIALKLKLPQQAYQLLVLLNSIGLLSSPNLPRVNMLFAALICFAIKNPFLI